MVFDSKNNKILLFGGGRSELSGDPMNITLAYGDTWEYDGTGWTQRTTTVAPSARSGFGLAYSTGSGKAYLFGGIEVTTYNAPGTPKQQARHGHGYHPRQGPPVRRAKLDAHHLSPGRRGDDARVPDLGVGRCYSNLDRSFACHPGAVPQPELAPPAVVYDETRKKLAIFGFAYYGDNASYWEWDPDSGAFSMRVLPFLCRSTRKRTRR